MCSVFTINQENWYVYGIIKLKNNEKETEHKQLNGEYEI